MVVHGPGVLSLGVQPLCFEPWCTGQCVQSLGARAIVSYVSVHGHRVLSIGARANDSLVLVHGLKCSKFRHKGHYVLGLGALATAF